MSTIRANTILDASGGSNAQLFGVASPPNSMGFRNRIINGDMRIDQRNNGASVTVAQNAAPYAVDRMQVGNFRSVAGTLTAQQSNVVPAANFTNSLFLTNNGAGASAAADAVFIQQKIEGFNASDFGWGTANAQSITISFWVRSSVPGTYGVSVRGSDRSYIGSVVISQANTWEFETLTIPGITTGTWNTTNGEGVALLFDLGIGSTYSQTGGSWQNTGNYGLTGGTKWYLTNGATFYITGVQLEAGTVASPFERRDYGRELMMCQRYYIRTPDLGAFNRANNWSGGFGPVQVSCDFPVTMRATPTVTVYGDINDGAQITLGGAGITVSTHMFSAYTNISNGQYVDLNYYIAAAEL